MEILALLQNNFLLTLGLALIGLVLLFLLFRVVLRMWRHHRQRQAKAKNLKDLQAWTNLDTLMRDKNSQQHKQARMSSNYIRVERAFSRCIAVVKRLRLIRRAVPVYVVVGEPQSGKTTLLQSVPTLLQGVLNDVVDGQSLNANTATNDARTAGASAAQGLGQSDVQSEQEQLAAQYNKPLVNFYYNQKTIMVDVDGRSFLDRWLDSAGAEWNSILELIFHRHRELNVAGLVISIPADALLADDTTTAAKKAAFIAECMHDFTKAGLMRVPVYIVITKLDYVTGFSEFVAGLSVDEQRNVLGFVYPSDEYDPEQVLECFNAQITALNQYLDEMLYDQFNQSVNGSEGGLSDIEDDPLSSITGKSAGNNTAAESSGARTMAAYLFPKALAKLQSSLMIYLNALFSEHEYIEARYARFSGLFLTSAINGHVYLNADFASLQNKKIDEAPLYSRYPTRRGQSFFTHGLFEQVFFQSILRAQLSRRRIMLDGMPYLIVTGVFGVLALSFVGMAAMQASSFKSQMDSQTSFYAGISNLFSNDTLDRIPLISVDLDYNGYPAYNMSMPGNSSISRLDYFYIIMTQLRNKIEVPYGFKSAALLQDHALLDLGFNKRSFIANEIQTCMVFIPAVRSTEFALMNLRAKPITKASSIALKELLTMDVKPDLYKDSHYDTSRLQNLFNYLIPSADGSVRQLLGWYDPRYNYLAEFNRIAILLSPERDRAIDAALNSLYQGYKSITNYPDSDYIRDRDAIIQGVELSRLYDQLLRFGPPDNSTNSQLSADANDASDSSSGEQNNKAQTAGALDQLNDTGTDELDVMPPVLAPLPPSQGDAMLTRSEDRLYFYKIRANQVLERIKFINDNSSAFSSFMVQQGQASASLVGGVKQMTSNVTNSLVNKAVSTASDKLHVDGAAINESINNAVNSQVNGIIEKAANKMLNTDPLSNAFDEYIAQFNDDLNFINAVIKERKRQKLSVGNGLEADDIFTRFTLQRDNLARAIQDQYRFINSERDALKQDPLFKQIVQGDTVTNKYNFNVLADLIKLTFYSRAGDEVTIDNFGTLLNAEKLRYERQLSSLEQYIQDHDGNEVVEKFGPVALAILDEQAMLSQVNIINSFLHLLPTNGSEFSSQIAFNYRSQHEDQGPTHSSSRPMQSYSNFSGVGNVYDRIKNAQRSLGEINFAPEFDPQGALVYSNNLAMLKEYLADEQNPLASQLSDYYHAVPNYSQIMQAMKNYLNAYAQYWGSFTDNIQLRAKSYAEFNHYVNRVRSYQINSSLLSLYNLSHAAVKNVNDKLLDDVEKSQKEAILERLQERTLTFNQQFNEMTATFLNAWASLPNTALAANSYVTALTKRQLQNSLLLLSSGPNEQSSMPFYTHLVNLGTNLIKDEAFNIAHQNLAYYQAEFVHFPLVQDSEYNEEPLNVEQLVRFERLLKSLGLDRYTNKRQANGDPDSPMGGGDDMSAMMDSMTFDPSGSNSENQSLELQMPILFKSSFVTDKEILDWADSCLQVIDLLVNRPKKITFSVTIPSMREQEALLHSRGVSLPSALSRMRYINATSDDRPSEQRYYTFQDGKKDTKPSELLRTTLNDGNLKFKLYQFSDDKHAESEAQINGAFAVLRAYFDPNSIYDSNTNTLTYPLFLKDSKGVPYCLFINFNFSEPLLPLDKWPTTYRWPKI